MKLMEIGELDMNKILERRGNADDAKFDASFVRHYWKEMLECLQAIHEHDIVHSDLKAKNVTRMRDLQSFESYVVMVPSL